jgi:hypothetical protein
MSDNKSCPIYQFWNVDVPKFRNKTITKEEIIVAFMAAIDAIMKLPGKQLLVEHAKIIVFEREFL